MHLIQPASPTWSTPVLTCSSVVEGGTKNIWETILDHEKKFKGSGEFLQKRKRQSLAWMWTLVEYGLKQRFKNNEKINREIPAISNRVENDQISPTAAAEELLAYL